MSAAHINRLQLLLGTAFSTLSLGLGAGDAVAQAEPDIEEIVVSGKYIPDEKRATSEVSSLIDAEDFALSGDSDAAAALRRVTGLSLVGDGFVFVRGLGERYSKALLNGAELPSPQPLERVVPLDVFPAGFLESVLVQKTHSSQYPSEFGGGVVALRTKGLPDENFISFGVSSGFDLASSLMMACRLKAADLISRALIRADVNSPIFCGICLLGRSIPLAVPNWKRPVNLCRKIVIPSIAKPMPPMWRLISLWASVMKLAMRRNWASSQRQIMIANFKINSASGAV
ncbi:TonB-dependent receptor plug domain-containing protein [Iodidimonas nitroreducens]|uniref:TonB-dependent receptor plug domain-containing protein n=1 Tax=Iodidimonas nitroreducens TaxID=1236968 RepID=UPI0012315921|nr:TonB-dependent receptor plug domain-containing protein [Iodidimonas nitroreducens]